MRHLSSNGGGICNAYPDVCKTPAPPAPFAPIPYPNIGQCSQAKGSTCSSKVKILNKKAFTKKTKLSRSSGDEAGTMKGLKSSTNMSSVQRSAGESKVKIEGTPIVTVLARTAHNGSNANAPPGVQSKASQTKVTFTG